MNQIDPTPRIAIATAFAPELKTLRNILAQRGITPEVHRINGISFYLAQLGDQPIVIYLSGMSVVNAAMTTQLVLDRFTISAIIVSGIAGSADPALNVGDVILPARWGQYLEMIVARETPAGFVPPPFLDSLRLLDAPGFGAIFPRRIETISDREPHRQQRFWFDTPDHLLEAARAVAADLTLEASTDPRHSLSHQPRIIVGGNGLSGPAFVDNAALREWAHSSFDAQVLDMESAAVAHVAWCNQVDFIAVRSVSDLAGGGADENEMAVFMELAASNSSHVVLALIAEIADRTGA